MDLLSPEAAESFLSLPALPQAAMDRAIETAAVAITARRIIAFMWGCLPDVAATVRRGVRESTRTCRMESRSKSKTR
ncbi:hypothetical protein GCM10018790_62200 [Kitasatospora xanthocidica]|nr:hypothetical protein GCM10018790_62200 [Kitasatospora xanthocidica]